MTEPNQQLVDVVADAMRFWSHQSADVYGRCWVYEGGKRHSHHSDVDEAAEAARRLNALAAIQATDGECQRLGSALTFYANEWEQDVDAEQTAHGWVGSIGEVTPTEALCKDAGRIARTALKEQSK